MTEKSRLQQVDNIKENELMEKRELIDPLDHNFPLLKEFRERAPGSFKHTQALVGIIDNVAAAIDLDSEALKMAAMYHDIGKMWAPQFFSENQPPDENIHNNLDPQISYYILTRHVSDSVAILIAHNFPEDVICMVSQHHGTTILKAMYEKAQALNPKDEVSKEFFRYKTQKPDSLESLILLLSDHIEATSRSFYVDQHQDLDTNTFVADIFNKLMKDGQFNDVAIRLGHLGKIQEALISDIASNFHKRVKYDEDDELIIRKDEEGD